MWKRGIHKNSVSDEQTAESVVLTACARGVQGAQDIVQVVVLVLRQVQPLLLYIVNLFLGLQHNKIPVLTLVSK